MSMISYYINGKENSWIIETITEIEKTKKQKTKKRNNKNKNK